MYKVIEEDERVIAVGLDIENLIDDLNKSRVSQIGAIILDAKESLTDYDLKIVEKVCGWDQRFALSQVIDSLNKFINSVNDTGETQENKENE
jgi:hypothetical protein